MYPRVIRITNNSHKGTAMNVKFPYVLLLTFFLAFLSTAAAAQATQTEKDAAAETLKNIEDFQKKHKPTALAEKMAAKKDKKRDAVVARAEELWNSEMQDLSDWIGRNPEIGFVEYLAVDTLTKVLKNYGFSVQTGVAGLETAFVGQFDSPAGTNGPKLGVILEYDALRDANGPYHGDQHNAQGPTGLAAAFAIMEYMKSERVPGQIYVYGTPAEEMGPPSKAIMLDKGVFKDADFIVRSHSGSKFSRSEAGFGSCCYNINMVRYIFQGKITHQMSSWTGRNALEAGVMFYTAVDRMRSSWRKEASIQGVIPFGGEAPNNVPDSVVVDYYIRYTDEVYRDHITDMMENAAKGAALATGTKVTVDPYGTLSDGISISTLEELSFAYSKKYAESPDDVSHVLSRPAGFEETGQVAQVMPGVGVSLASSTAPNHSRQMLADTFTEVGHRGFRTGSKVMAAILYEFLTDSSFRSLVKQEHQMLSRGYNNYLQNLREAYYEEMHITYDQ